MRSLRRQTRKKITYKDPLEEAMKIKKALKEKVYGQKLAIDAVVDSIKNKVVKSENMPQHIFFFLGPPATGKTYLAQVIAENLIDYNFFDVSMSEYQTHNNGQTLYGTDRGYTTESNGVLTSYVKKNPKSVILFDEFEKAHTMVQRRLLTILSDGYLRDALGWLPAKSGLDDEVVFNSTEHSNRLDELFDKVDFTQTIVIFTSNLGSELYNNHTFLDSISSDYYQAETMILQELSKETKLEANIKIPAIVPEMLSRLSQGKTVLFKPLKMKELRQVAADVFTNKLRELTKTHNLKFSYNSKSIPFIQAQLLKFAPHLDVRRVKSKIYEQFTDKLTDFLLSNNLVWKDIKKIDVIVSSNVEEFTKKHILPGIKDETLLKFLFRKNYTLKLTDSVTKDGDVLVYKLDTIEFKKLNKVADLVGDTAISFDTPSTSFDDVDGHIEPIKRLKEIAQLLKNPEQLEKFDAKIPKGMLLYGKPGTGKTMLAEAFSNYADLPFIATTANDLINFSSNNFDRLKEVFKRAKDYAPSIIFIDEIDTFGTREKGGSISAINELLTQINGFSNDLDETVFIIAATNYMDRIDDAILRPGRIELHVEIPSLDKTGREAFIKRILEKPSEKNIDEKKLVMYTAGMTGAQLEKIANESSLYAIRNNLDKLTQTSIIEQINIEKYGHRLNLKSIEDELGEVAYHEAGHAVLASLLVPKLKIEQITITPRKNTLGFVAFNIENASSNLSKKDLENQIAISLAGRMAQMKKFGEDSLDTGASEDLKRATQLAYKSIAYYGMDEELGYINLDSIKHSDIQQNIIDKKVVALIAKIKIETKNTIDKNWGKITRVAKELLEKEVIHEEELAVLLTMKEEVNSE